MGKFLLVLLHSMIVWKTCIAQSSDNADLLIEKIRAGEKNLGDYHAPMDPILYHNSNTNELSTYYDYYRNFQGHQSSETLFKLIHGLKSDLMPVAQCSNEQLGKNYDYIKYLFRLISLNYLYESLIKYHYTGYSFGFGKNFCMVNWPQALNFCRPSSLDMRVYISRLRTTLEKPLDNSLYVSYPRKQVAEEIQKINNVVNFDAENSDISYNRVKLHCNSENMDCSNMDKNLFHKTLQASCRKDFATFVNICSENDTFYGLSRFPLFQKILHDSNVANLVESDGSQCLARFGELFKRNEYIDEYLIDLFSFVYTNLTNSKDQRYVQGRIFVPGALKEFDVKGLRNFLFKPKKRKVVIRRKKVTPEVKEIPKPKVKPVIVAKPAPKPKKIKVVRRVVKKKTSAFEIAVQRRDKLGLTYLDVDMTQFLKDYTFSEVVLQKLKKPLKKFQTRDALKQMKKFDKLGTRGEPVSLTFLKYMLDNNAHQGLFNVISILGEKMYVINDFERKKTPVYIRLQNNKDTGWKWQITIVDPNT